MTIIEKIEEKYNFKIKYISKMKQGMYEKITKNDLKIINSHKFIIKNAMTIQCARCLVEADIFHSNKLQGSMICFFENKDINGIDFKSCQELMMLKACE